MDTSISNDVWMFLESCQLSIKQLTNLRRNLPNAFADGCCCADIITHYFPRIISRHNYSESSSSQGRQANWNLLNKKVLKRIRMEIDSNLIDTFINRKSSEAVQTFIRLLRTKLIAYEPIYATMSFVDEDAEQPKVNLFEKATRSSMAATASTNASTTASTTAMNNNNAIRRSSVVSSTDKKINNNSSSNNNSIHNNMSQNSNLLNKKVAASSSSSRTGQNVKTHVNVKSNQMIEK